MKQRKITISIILLILALIAALVAALPAFAQDVESDSDTSEYDPSVCAGSAELDELTADCLAMIEAFPEPPFEAIPQDRQTLGTYSFWRVGPAATATYSAPDGGVVGEIPAGFNFVTAIDLSVEGWLQIQGGQWVRRDQASYTQPSYFSGVLFPEDGWDHAFAWVLDLSYTYVSAYPGGPASQETGRFLNRYELVNIFDTEVDDDGWRWYMIGPNQWVKQTFVSKYQPMLEEEKPEDVEGRWAAVDLYEQTFVAYEDDIPVFATVIASGIPPFETNEGLFTVWARLERDGMSGATGAPEAYDLQTVPWVLYFDDGISLHGTYWHDLFGYRQSHGCVNLTVSDARYVYQWMTSAEPNEDGEIVNHVYVHSTGSYGENVVRQ